MTTSPSKGLKVYLLTSFYFSLCVAIIGCLVEDVDGFSLAVHHLAHSFSELPVGHSTPFRIAAASLAVLLIASDG